LSGTTPPNNGVAAFIGKGAHVTATTGNIDLEAIESVHATLTAGGGGGGVAAFGAAVADLSIISNTPAVLDAHAVGSAQGTITVNAHLHDVTSVNAFAGQGGAALALGAQVAIVTDRSTQSAAINSGAQVLQAGALLVQAGGDRNLTADTVGVAVAGVAAGADVSQATAGGSADAHLGSGVQVRQQSPIGGDVMINAKLQDHVEADGLAVAAGIGAGAGNEVDATINPTVSAAIGSDANVTANGSVTVEASAPSPFAHADSM